MASPCSFRLLAATLSPHVATIALLAAISIPAGAQSAAPASPTTAVRTNRATVVQGTVTDPDGGRVPSARVVVVQALAVVATTLSDASGAFTVSHLPAGRYEVRVSAPGFRTAPVEFTLRPGDEVDLPIRLHVSAVAESVVVSAAQVELPMARAADSVTVLTARDLRIGQAETVADALRTVPGLAVARNGGRGAVTSLFPRGGESDFTLVLVDGVKVNAFGGGYDFSLLPASGVERVEVVRGPESALFGADAIGAVVQVVTRHGGEPRVEGVIEHGSHGTSRLSAGSWGSRGRWSWGVSAERVSTSGLTGETSTAGERVTNDDFGQRQVALTGAWRISGGGDVRGSVNVSRSERGYPGPFGSNPIGAYTGIDTISRGVTTVRQYGARWLQPWGWAGGRVRQTTSVGYLDVGSDFASAYGQSTSTTSRLSVRTQTDVTVSDQAALSAGVEVHRERATSTYIVADAAGEVPVRRRHIGAFAEWRSQPLPRLSVTGGVRIEHIERDALAADSTGYAPRPAFGADGRTSINPRVSAAFLLPGPAGARSWTRLHAAAGTGMRAPDALEIAFTDNPDLAPERSRSLEAGVEEALLGERLVVGATVFFNDYDDLIVAVGPALQDASRYRTDNISNARSRGVEVSASLRTRWGLDARAAYTFLSTQVLAVDRIGSVAPSPFTVGDPLLRRPRHAASLDLAFTRGAVTAFARAGGRGRVLDVEPSWGTYGGLFQAAGYTVVDAGASWTIARRIEVFGRVGNLLDRRYEETFGFPALGRQVVCGVRVAAGR